jgi:hypothetical protein
MRTCKEHNLVCVAALDERLHRLEPVTSLRVLLAGQVVQPLVLGGLQATHVVVSACVMLTGLHSCCGEHICICLWPAT